MTGLQANRLSNAELLPNLSALLAANLSDASGTQPFQEPEQLFRDLAESLPQLIWVADAKGTKTYCNRLYLEYTGIPSVAAMNLYWQDLIHPDDRKATSEAWKRCLINQSPYFSEYRLRRHDGIYRHFLARATPLRNKAGELQRWLGSSTDVHDQKLAEIALRKSEKLEAAGRLAASISHQINNPLAAVTNALYLALLDTNLSKSTYHYLKLAEEGLERVAHATTQTLGFHRQATAPALVDLSETMDSVLGLFAERLAAASIQVDRHYRGSMSLSCFYTELRQVFAILVGNSLDATSNGGDLRIRMRESHAWNETQTKGIRIIVADTGHGVPIALRPLLFEAFVTTKDTTGTGLGLWVADGIVRHHGGRISFRSSTDAVRRGTVFSLFLPFDGISRP
jgi:PAS domain S-box-containing protein